MYGRKPVVNSDDDSDFGSRYNKPTSSYGLSSARGASSRDMDSFTRDSRDRYSRDNRRDNERDNYSRDSHFDKLDSRDNIFTRDSRDNFTRDSRDNFSRDSRNNFNSSRDRDFRRDHSFSNRDIDKPSDSFKFDNYRNGNKYNSDSSDDEPSNSRYGGNSRRLTRNSSDSDDSDKYGRRRTGASSGRPMTSSRKEGGIADVDSYEGANQKLKMMIQWDRSLCEQLDDLYENKMAKEKKVEQLKEEIHKDSIKEDGLRKKLSELRSNRKMLQARMDEFK